MVSARTALLMSLRAGPCYGRELLRRIGRATDGRLRLSEGTMRPALRQLRKSGLVEAWSVIPGRMRGGRSRTYHALTIEGIRQSEELANTLHRIAAAGREPARPSPTALREMRRRAERVAELFDAVSVLRSARPERRRRT